MQLSWCLSAEYWLTGNQIFSLLFKMNALRIHFNLSLSEQTIRAEQVILWYTSYLFGRRPSAWMTENKIRAAWLRWHLAYVLLETADPTGLIRVFFMPVLLQNLPPIMKAQGWEATWAISVLWLRPLSAEDTFLLKWDSVLENDKALSMD